MNARFAAATLTVVVIIVSTLLFAAPASAANVNLKITGATDVSGTPVYAALSYSGNIGAASVAASANTKGEAQLKLGLSHSYKLASGSSGKATAAATWHRAERPWQGWPSWLGIAVGDWLHLDAGLSVKAPASSKYRPSAAIDADIRVYPLAPARNYFQAVASGGAQLAAAAGPSMSIDATLGAKLMPGNPKWTAVFGSAGLDAQWKQSRLSPSLALAARGRAYPESMAKSYATASADLRVSPALADGHKIELSAGATGKARPLKPELSTVAARASAKWSYTVPRGVAAPSLQPTFTASAATSTTLWHNSPERRSSVSAALKAGASLPLPGGFSLAADASWRNSGQYDAADDEPDDGDGDGGDTGGGEDESQADATASGLTLGFTAKWAGSSTPQPAVSLRVSGARQQVGGSSAAGAAAPFAATAADASAWLIRAEVAVSCKF